MLEVIEHPGHILFRQLVEHAANGAEDFHVLAGNAVPVEVGDDGLQLVADALGGGLELLLLEELLLKEAAGGVRRLLSSRDRGNRPTR